MNTARRLMVAVMATVLASIIHTPANADPARDAILADLAIAAKAADPAFDAFSADRGKTLWNAKHSGGKPDTPSCTTCHGLDPTKAGETRAGKPIEPMAVSITASRFTNPDEVAKWFKRNCNSVLGRDCTAIEMGDVITYLSGQ